MFVRANIINKLIARAYKQAGCYVTLKDGYIRVYPDNHSWLLEALEDELDNKIKAKIMELAGVIPTKDNTGIRFSKEYSTEYLEKDEIYDVYKLDVTTDDMSKRYNISDYLIECSNKRVCRVLVDQNGECELALEEGIHIVDARMDEDGVIGPYLPIWSSASVRWSNWKGSFQFWLESYDQGSETAEHIAMMNQYKIGMK